MSENGQAPSKAIAKATSRERAAQDRQDWKGPVCGVRPPAAPKIDELARLRALARLDLLDSPRERPFDLIVDLVCQAIDVPICAISLVDQDRQWFKAIRGFDAKQSARDSSFCSHAINAAVPFIVKDAINDALFVDSPLVTGQPHIRSYAGIPLITAEGFAIGTLCAIDVVPRDFSPSEIAILANCAKVVMGEIELRQVASTDVLTGVMSRRSWTDCAEREVPRAQRYGGALSFLMIDVDRFKAINDRLGHQVGDQVLIELAQTIGELMRESDWFGRYGGEEFVAALPETNLAQAAILAERIRTVIATKRFACLGDQACTVSIGVAMLARAETSCDPALNRADQGLYLAKKMGRNQVKAMPVSAKPPSDRAAA